MGTNRNVTVFTRCAVVGLLATLSAVTSSADSSTAQDAQGRISDLQKRQQIRNEVFDPLDSKSVSEVEVKCPQHEAVLGNVTCESNGKSKGLFDRVERLTRQMISKRNGERYAGLSGNPAAGIAKSAAVPVCDIMSGEGEDLDKAYLAKEANKDASQFNHNFISDSKAHRSARFCGWQCNMSISTGMFSGSMNTDDKAGGCDWEYGQYRGGQIHVENYFKEQVFRELRNRRIKLLDIDGAKPCQEVAADVIRMQGAIHKVTDEIIQLHDGDMAKIKALKCPVKMPGADGSDTAVEQGSKDPKELDPAGIGVCHMYMANYNLIQLYAKLADCEIFWRSSKVFEDILGDPDHFIKEVKGALKPKCEEAGHCQKGGQDQCDGIGCCSDGLRTRLWNECYTRELPKFMKKKFGTWPTSTPVERPKDIPQPASPSHSSNAMNWAFALGALSGLRRDRRRRGGGPMGDFMKRYGVFIVLALLALVFASGCDCSPADDSLPCKPCVPPQQQTKGCLYKTCLQSLFVCIHVNSGPVGAVGHIMTDSTTGVQDDVGSGAGASGTNADANKDLQSIDRDGNGWGDSDRVVCYSPRNGENDPSPTGPTNMDAILSLLDGRTKPDTQCFLQGGDLGYAPAGASGAGPYPHTKFWDELPRSNMSGLGTGTAIAGAGLAMGTAATAGMDNMVTAGLAAAGTYLLEREANDMQFHDYVNKLDQWGRVHDYLYQWSVDDARKFCQQLVGIDASNLGNSKQSKDEYNGTGTIQSGNLGTGQAANKEYAAFITRLQERQQNDETADPNDPACQHQPKNQTNESTGGVNSDGGAQDLSDARGLFGGGSIGADKGKSKAGGKEGGGAATAATKNLPDKAQKIGADGHKGSGGPAVSISNAAGNGSIGGGGGGNDPTKGGGAATAGSSDAADAADGASGQVVGQNTAFDSAGSGGGRGGKSSDPFGGLFGGGAAGPAGGGVGNVGFGDGGGAGDAKADADGLANTKMSLFEIINRRMDKYGRSIE